MGKYNRARFTTFTVRREVDALAKKLKLPGEAIGDVIKRALETVDSLSRRPILIETAQESALSFGSGFVCGVLDSKIPGYPYVKAGAFTATGLGLTLAGNLVKGSHAHLPKAAGLGTLGAAGFFMSNYVLGTRSAESFQSLGLQPVSLQPINSKSITPDNPGPDRVSTNPVEPVFVF